MLSHDRHAVIHILVNMKFGNSVMYRHLARTFFFSNLLRTFQNCKQLAICVQYIEDEDRLVLHNYVDKLSLFRKQMAKTMHRRKKADSRSLVHEVLSNL